MKFTERYDSLFQYYGQTHEVPWRLLKSQAMAESSLNPDAVNPITGAAGLSQFMKPTSDEEFKGGQKDRLDPEESIRGQALYLAKLHTNVRMTLGAGVESGVITWRMALCSYNCGWGYVRRAILKVMNEPGGLTWTTFGDALAAIELNGKHVRIKETLPYAEKILSEQGIELVP